MLHKHYASDHCAGVRVPCALYCCIAQWCGHIDVGTIMLAYQSATAVCLLESTFGHVRSMSVQAVTSVPICSVHVLIIMRIIHVAMLPV
jgi:hypothetical protein